MVNAKIHAHLEALKHADLYRQRHVLSSQPGFLQFSSNDYLGLSRDSRVLDAYAHGYKNFGSGSGGSMVICGYHATHQALERAFADFLDVDDCLLFSSGYAANLAIARLLNTLQMQALIDKGLHASFYDGLFLTKTAFGRYLHNNLQDFARKSRDLPENSIIITEGIFSISGQKAPLNRLVEPGFPLIVDEAHSFGLEGPAGKGAVFACALTQAEVPLRVIPLGKACAGQGAVIAGQACWIDALLQSARSLIYSTAISPALAFGLQKTLEIVMQSDDKRQKLDSLIQIFRKSIQNSPLKWTDSTTPIQQLILGSARQSLELSEKLREKGIICMAIRYPTVHPSASGLRIVLNANHEERDIQHLFSVLHGSIP